MSRSIRKYTSFRKEAVHLALKAPSITDAASELGVPVGTLHSWIHVLRKKGDLSLVDASGSKDMVA